ncbi:hypothetical protein OESDEN_00509 [Oesophagostomum dentatum]|uniref:Uncharacterized protein n=1 Tax=Oesophagostomum dentatum TaxID=61180 RepID=A0A0B1TPJ1_OESDE|nr:hypothetical protein OESDEN_00509 [Oesophagostomum dentatum]
MQRCPSRLGGGRETSQTTTPLPKNYEQAIDINPKQYFELLTQINKHREVAALMKQFSSELKSFAVVLNELEQILLPDFPRAFLGVILLHHREAGGKAAANSAFFTSEAEGVSCHYCSLSS